MLNVLALYYVCIDFLSNNAIKSVFLNFFLTVKGKRGLFFFLFSLILNIFLSILRCFEVKNEFIKVIIIFLGVFK